MKNKSIKIGRPVKVPKGNFQPIGISEAEKIFKNCAAPESWGATEINAIWCVLMKKQNPVLVSPMEAEALKFGNMFADEPDAMLKMMPRFKRLADKHFHSPQTRMVQYISYLHSIAESGKSSLVKSRLQDFWHNKADKIAIEYSKSMGKRISGKDISKARDQLRRLFPKVLKKR